MAISTDLLSQWTVGIILLSLLVSYYVHRGCPYLVRGSAILLFASYVFKFLSVNAGEAMFCNDTFKFQFCSWWKQQYHQNNLQVTLWIAFLTSAFVKYWWGAKIDHFRDLADSDTEGIGKRRDVGAIPPPYPNGWFPILQSRDLSRGKVKLVRALGTELAVFRSENGKAHVLNAYCPHLGANLAVGGKVVGNCLECPFHGWQFNGDGRCVRIPYAKKVPDIAKTRSWTSCELNDFIYIWYHEAGEKPSWEVPEIEEITQGKWIYRGRVQHIVRCHVQDISENGSDMAHLKYLHSPWTFRGVRLANPFGLFILHEWMANWKQSDDSPHLAKMNLTQYLSFFGTKVPFTYRHFDIQLLGPVLAHIFFRESPISQGVLLHYRLPEGPTKQRLVHHLYTHPLYGQLLSNYILKVTAVMKTNEVLYTDEHRSICSSKEILACGTTKPISQIPLFSLKKKPSSDISVGIHSFIQKRRIYMLT